MKYTIEGFSQEYALTLKKNIITKYGVEKTIKIDFTDLVILRWFVDFYPNMKKMIINGKEYVWLSHKKLLNDLPLLDISKRACIERMQKLVEFEILEYRFVKDGGTFSLYTFGKNYINMICCEKSNTQGVYGQDDTGGVCSNEHGVHAQTDTKDTSIEKTSIDYDKKNKYNKEKISKKEIDTEFESLWKRYPNKKGKESAYKSYAKARANGTTYDEVINGLENYLKEIEVKKTATQYIKHGSTWFSQHCWQDEYVTVVEEKPNEYDSFVGELNKWLESEE